MNKDEILSKSRKENKGKDLYEIEIQSRAGIISGIVVLALATFIFIIQILATGDFDLGLYAIVFSFGATSFIVKAASMKRKSDIVMAVVYTIATIILTIIHLYPLIITWLGS